MSLMLSLRLKCLFNLNLVSGEIPILSAAAVIEFSSPSKGGWAQAKTVIVAKRGILPELIEDKVNGLVIEDTPENLAKAIMFMVENPELCKKMGRNARTKALELFNLEKQAAKIENIYKKILSRHT